jgi:peptidyl-prolyl cis-trans isomerase B (cyclophilin B)
MHAVLDTTKGAISVLLRTQEAPKTCENFVKLAKEGFYTNVKWHRVIPHFVAQAGCPKGDGTGGPGYNITHEPTPRKHEKGAVAMARLDGDQTHASQFYIARTRLPHLDGQYTVFGNVTAGIQILDRLTQGDTIRTVRILKD